MNKDSRISYSFVPNHRETMKALARTQLSAREWNLLILVLNQTDGYLREHDAISWTFFENETGVKRQYFSRLVASLCKKGILRKEKQGKTCLLMVNHPKHWKSSVLRTGTTPHGAVEQPSTGLFADPPTTPHGAVEQPSTGLFADPPTTPHGAVEQPSTGLFNSPLQGCNRIYSKDNLKRTLKKTSFPSDDKSSSGSSKEKGPKETSRAPPGIKRIPELLEPLSALPGFKRRSYEKDLEIIRVTCAQAGAPASEVVVAFAKYYSVGRLKHGWLDPVKALRNTLAVQISKLLKEQGYGSAQKYNAASKDTGRNGDYDPYAKIAPDDPLATFGVRSSDLFEGKD